MTAVVLTIGTFDILHPGHLELLRACRDMADLVVVAVNRDAFVGRYKGHRPVQPLEHRMEVLRAVRYVDHVVPNIGDEDGGAVIDCIRPNVVAIGSDWLDPGHDERRYHAQLGIDADWLEGKHVRIVYVARTRGTSSTALRTA